MAAYDLAFLNRRGCFAPQGEPLMEPDVVEALLLLVLAEEDMSGKCRA